MPQLRDHSTMHLHDWMAHKTVLDPQNCTFNSYQHIILWRLIQTGFLAIWLARKWLNNIVRSTFLLQQQIICPASDWLDIGQIFLSFSIFGHWLTKQKICNHRTVTYLFIGRGLCEVPLYISLWKLWCYISNSLLTCLLVRSILVSTWHGPHKLGSYRKMGHYISLCEVRPYHAFSPILTSFDESEKFRALIYPNFGVLLQEK